MLTTFRPQLKPHASIQENAIVLQCNYSQKSFSVNDAKQTNTSIADSTIKQRIVSTQAKDYNELNYILTKVQTIIKNNLEKFNSQLEVGLTINLQSNLKYMIHSMPVTVKPENIREFLLFTLHRIQKDIPMLKQIIRKNILLDKSIVDLKKNSPYQEEISTAIINLATVYKQLEADLVIMLNELNLLIQTSINILETTNFIDISSKEQTVLKDTTLTLLFETTAPLHFHLKSLLQKTRNDKKLDDIEKQLKQQKTPSSHKTEDLSIDDFLEPNKIFIQDILIGKTQNMLYLLKIIDGVYNMIFS